MDRTLPTHPTLSKKPQEYDLVAMVCLLIAAKFEEREKDVPSIADVAEHLGYRFSAERVKRTEIQLLNALKWDLVEYTPLHFLAHYLHRGVLFEDDRMYNVSRPSLTVVDVEKCLNGVTRFFAELVVQEYAFRVFTPSVVAAAIVVVSRKYIGVVPCWRPGLEGAMRCTRSDVERCANMVLTMYKHLTGGGRESDVCGATAAVDASNVTSSGPSGGRVRKRPAEVDENVDPRTPKGNAATSTPISPDSILETLS